MSVQIQMSKGSVRYAFKESKKNLEEHKQQESLIYLYFSYGAERLKYSVGYKSCFANWDFKKQRIKNISSLINKDKVNQDLKHFEDSILSRYQKLYMDYGDGVTNEMIKKELDIIVRKKHLVESDKEIVLSFIDVCNKFIDDKGTSIAPVTKRVYKQAITILEKYEKKKQISLSFEAIDMPFYNSFKAFLEKENYSLNTIGKHIKTIKSFMNYAFVEGYTASVKHQSRDFKVEKEITTEIYLSDAEIKVLHNKDLSKTPVLEHARDVFLIGCYTGQRVSDYNSLSKDDIVTKGEIQYFKFVQQKNRKRGRVVMCPITKEIREIMDKRYGGVPPPSIPEQHINEHIKTIGLDLQWTESIKCEQTKGGKLVTEMIPKYKLLKSHTARRSFCTNMYLRKMPIFDIMLFSGHTTEKEFYRYIRIKEEERAQHIVDSGYFNV
ncbi:site-specific integrase [Flavobacterium galactosidilyticum]|uniref:site-specific integrase n=1 Tax=Flavobacterium galactosidilyticum TaxID=2893886 RepID=UPI001E3D100F|nr:site-specific integrase [Flavobacterium sp. F-340]UFH46906.1 site-specific integrase [Flavobacterium sp. F-340]